MSQVEDQDSLSIKPSQEDIDFRQRTSNASRGGAVPVKSAQDPDRPNRTLGALWLTVTLLLVSSGGMYWLLQQLQQQHLAQQQTLVQLSQSVRVLEQKLSITGETASSSLTALQAALKTQESEIRKLWDIANKRNKSWIRELQATHATAKKQVEQLSMALKALQRQQVDTHKTQQAVAERVNTLQSTVNSLEKDTKDTYAQFLAVQAEIESLQSKIGSVPSAVQKKMDDIEEAIAAIDATRVKQARNITQLGEEIRQLKAKVIPSTQMGAGILAQ